MSHGFSEILSVLSEALPKVSMLYLETKYGVYYPDKLGLYSEKSLKTLKIQSDRCFIFWC